MLEYFLEILHFYELVKYDKQYFEVQRINLKLKYLILFGSEELVCHKRLTLAFRRYSESHVLKLFLSGLCLYTIFYRMQCLLHSPYLPCSWPYFLLVRHHTISSADKGTLNNLRTSRDNIIYWNLIYSLLLTYCFTARICEINVNLWLNSIMSRIHL
jgi:hypothetical protein